jgi:hypothetical protein
MQALPAASATGVQELLQGLLQLDLHVSKALVDACMPFNSMYCSLASHYCTQKADVCSQQH